MTDQDQSRLRRIAWSEVFPWLLLVRCFRIALQLRLLALGGLGILLTLAGWVGLGLLLGPGDDRTADDVRPYAHCPWLAATAPVADLPALARDRDLPAPGPSADPFGPARLVERQRPAGWGAVAGWQGPFWRAWEPFWGSWEHLARPFRLLFLERSMTAARLAFLLCCGLWAVAVWALFGGAITRAAAYQLASHERLGFGKAFGYALRKWRSYFAGPVIPMLGMLVLAAPVAVLGWFLRADLGTIVAGLFWPLALVAGFLLALLTIGLLFGWPLLWCGVSAEGPDVFDAIGRSYNYTYQRPLHYLFYAALAALLGALGWAVVSAFFTAVLWLTWWAASWGGGNAAWQLAAAPADFTSARGVGGVLVRFWVECVKLLGTGFLLSYFWTAAAGVYLLLRRDVDATELDEVWLEEEAEASAPPLPAAGPPAEPRPEDVE